MKDNGSNLFLLSSLERGGTGVDGLAVNSPSISPFSLCPLSCLSLPFSFSSSCQPAALGWHLQQLGRHRRFRRGVRWHFSQFFSPSFPSPLPLAGKAHGIGETTRFEELVRAGNKGGKRRLEPTVAVWGDTYKRVTCTFFRSADVLNRIPGCLVAYFCCCSRLCGGFIQLTRRQEETMLPNKVLETYN